MEILEYCYPWPGEDRRQRKNRARERVRARLEALVMANAAPRIAAGGNASRWFASAGNNRCGPKLTRGTVCQRGK
jgi:hypothetical protein